MIVHCPSCGRAHQASDSLLGQRVRCTECNHVFIIQEDAEEAPASTPPASPPDADAAVPGEPTPPTTTPTTTPATSLAEPATSPAPETPSAPQVPHVPHTPHPGPWASLARAAKPAPQPPTAEAGRFLGRFDPARSLRLGRVLLLAGLVLIVLARGLETITVRGAARLQAKAALEPTVFEEGWSDRIESATKDLHEPDRAKQRKELSDKRDAERAELNEGDWRDLKRAADHAADRGRVRIYWLEWVFFLGALALTLGVAIGGLLATGTERVICLVLIAVIAFSLFVGGTAWRTVFLPAGS